MICSLVSKYFDSPQLAIQWKQTVQNFRLLILRYAQFEFFRKGSGTSFSTTFCVYFSRKMFLMLHSINWPNFIVWLSLLPSRDIGQYVYYNCLLSRMWRLKFEINLIFLIKPFWYMTEKSRQKFKYNENEKSFWGEIKSIFHNF